jgi:hypothetical protein
MIFVLLAAVVLASEGSHEPMFSFSPPFMLSENRTLRSLSLFDFSDFLFSRLPRQRMVPTFLTGSRLVAQ